MATRSHTTFKKRQKEQARLEKRQEKLARRQQRKLDGPEAEPEIDPITGLPIEPEIDPETGLPIERDSDDADDDAEDGEAVPAPGQTTVS
ncbi:MAG: hypothetical protein IPP47_31280 [Bryobacterales bacterium]|nr:hypothetical protein [Bryobacterales bacterium]